MKLTNLFTATSKLAAATALLFTLACATTPDTIPTDGAVLRQVERIVTRHDMYVNADTALQATDRQVFIAQSGMVMVVMHSGPKVAPERLAQPLLPVCDRTDTYTRVDTHLTPLEKETYLATTDGLRGMLRKLAPAPKTP